MILGIDVGNTNITLALLEDGEVSASFRLTTKTPRTSDEFGVQMLALLSTRGVSAAGPEDLVIIFSYTGIYFDYGLPRHVLRGGPKAWLVTGCPDIRERFAQKGLPAHRLLTFRSGQDFASHPYQLQMAASLIAQRVGAVSPLHKW